MILTERNLPCHCGSGKKYKKCCYLNLTKLEAVEDTTAAMREAIQGQNFQSIDDAQAFVQNFSQQRNNNVVDDFQGLSPDQMHSLLNKPFDSPKVLNFNTSNLPDVSQVPIIYLCVALSTKLLDKAVKPTAKGNLPRNLCQEIARPYFEEVKSPIFEQPINKEYDFYDLNMTRHVMTESGLMRKYKGKFVLTKLMTTMLTPILLSCDIENIKENKEKQAAFAKLYLILLENYVTKFNWAYGGYNEDYSFIQDSFAYSLYLLEIKGKQKMSVESYAKDFIRAFPMVLDAADHESEYFSPEKQISSCYDYWVFRQFLIHFGLVELTEGDSKDFRSPSNVNTTDLFTLFVEFNV